MREEREALRLPVHYPLTISHYPYSWREWCRGTESNCRHQPFQGCALPTELPLHLAKFILVPSSSPEIKTLPYASHPLAVDPTRIGTGETGSLGGTEEHLQETGEDDKKPDY